MMKRKRMQTKSILILLSIIFILAMMPGTALAMTSCDIADTVSGSNYQLTAMSDSSNTAQSFSYTVPDSGVTVLMFFSTECGNSAYSFMGFAKSDWIANSKVNVVAIESHGATKDDTQAFMQEYAYGNQNFHTYYGNNSLQFAYSDLALNSYSVTWPLILVIDKEGGSNHIRYCSMGSLGADELGSAISALLNGDNSNNNNNGGNNSNTGNNGGSTESAGSEDSAATVNVTVAGVQNYDCANEIFQSVNQNRAANGGAAVTMNATLTEAAMQRAAEIAVYYSHTRANGLRCYTAFAGKYSGYSTVGENIAYASGGDNASRVMNMWMNSEGHRANILNSDFTQIGVGAFTTNNMTFYVQMFGNSTTNTAESTTTGSKTAKVTVETLPEHLAVALLSASSATTLSKNASGTYYIGTKTDDGSGYAALVPIVSNIKDSSNSSLTIANASVKNDGTGGVVLNAVAAGSGQVALKAYEGETNPQTFTLTVTDSSSSDNSGNAGNNGNSSNTGNTGNNGNAGNSGNNGNNSNTGNTGNTGTSGSTTTTHTAATAWSSNANSHWHACTVSGHTDKLNTAAHTAKTVAAVAATCSKTGLSAGSVCSVCGRTLVAQTTTAKTAHSYGAWTTTKAATATSTGTKVRTCNVCGNKETATIAATGVTAGSSSSGGGSSSSSSTKNAISTSTSSHGSISLSTKTAAKGDTVTITANPSSGYQVEAITVTDASGNAVNVTEKNGKYIFTMPSTKINIAAKFSEVVSSAENAGTIANTTTTTTTTTNTTTGSSAAKVFKDVRSGAWYESAVNYAQNKGLMNGETDTSFAPNNSMTRAMLMTVLARLDGQNTSGGATWYEKAMNWAVEKNISDGTNAAGEITREQLATMLYRYVGSPDVEGALSSFKDGAKVGAFAQKALVWAVQNGLIAGNDDGALNPDGNATRAEVAAILMRFCENFNK